MKRKAIVVGRMIILAGVMLISIFAIVLVARVLFGGLESSRQAQAHVMANNIAIFANTLATVESGRMQKDFTLSQGSKPMTVQVYDKAGNGVKYVKITYDDKGNSYEVPLLAKMDPVAPIRLNKVTVLKDITGMITITGDVGGGHELTATGDTACGTLLTKEKVIGYVNSAVSNPQVNKYHNVDAPLVKAVISAESSGQHCLESGYLKISKKGTVGLMQLKPGTAGDMVKFTGLTTLDYKTPEDNVKLGTAYLSFLMNRYGNDRSKAIAAYNWGLDNVDKRWPNLPEETQKYLAVVNGCYSSCSTNTKTCAIC